MNLRQKISLIYGLIITLLYLLLIGVYLLGLPGTSFVGSLERGERTLLIAERAQLAFVREQIAMLTRSLMIGRKELFDEADGGFQELSEQMVRLYPQVSNVVLLAGSGQVVDSYCAILCEDNDLLHARVEVLSWGQRHEWFFDPLLGLRLVLVDGWRDHTVLFFIDLHDLVSRRWLPALTDELGSEFVLAVAGHALRFADNKLTLIDSPVLSEELNRARLFGSEGIKRIEAGPYRLYFIHDYIALDNNFGFAIGQLVNRDDFLLRQIYHESPLILTGISLLIGSTILVYFLGRIVSQPLNQLAGYLDHFARERRQQDLVLHSYAEANALNMASIYLTTIVLENERVLNEAVALRTQELENAHIDLKQRFEELSLSRKRDHFNSLRQQVISRVYRASYTYPILEERLREILAALCVSDFGIQERGAIMLHDEGRLRMVAEIGLDRQVKQNCQSIATDYCFCGNTFTSQTFSISDHVDEGHEFRFDGMADHGHYGIPITYAGETYGVVLIYTNPGVPRAVQVEEFFRGMGEIIGLLISQHYLKARTQALLSALSQAGAAIAITDLRGRIDWANVQFERQAALPGNGAIGRDIGLFFSAESRKQIESELEDALHRSGQWIGETESVDREGTIRIEQVNVSMIEGLLPDERQLIWSKIDVTELRSEQQEREQLSRQLRRAQKMETVGQLTGGIAHDFNNILAAIIGYDELLMLDSDRFESNHLRYIEQIHAAGLRAKELIQQLLIFSRRDESGKLSMVEIRPMIKEVVKLLRSTMPNEMSIELDEAEGLDQRLWVEADPIGLHQILMNLAINARDAISGPGKVVIRLDLSERHRGNCASCGLPIRGRTVVIEVRDNGPGLPDVEQSRLFEPFYTTKDVGKGTGMGLSVVHGIVHRFNGHIEVGNLDPGARIRILLPLPKPGEEGAVSSDNSDSHASNECYRCLVVDDEEGVAETLCAMLNALGHKAEAIDGGESALARFSENEPAVDLLITDYSMPNLTGDQVARAFRQWNPHGTVVLHTGDSARAREQIGENGLFDLLLDKPATLESLSGLVSHVARLAGSEQ
jgi:PAS domain S-box-containing protein